MKLKNLMKLALALAFVGSAAPGYAEGFEEVTGVDLVSDAGGIFNGVGFMKPGQGIVYTRDENDDYTCDFVFYDKDFKVCASLTGFDEGDLLYSFYLSDSNNLISETKRACFFTQAFFNDDDDIEYLAFKSEEDYTVTYEVKQVISGKTIATLVQEFPKNVTWGYFDLDKYLNLGGNHYIQFRKVYGINDYDSVESYLLYRVNGNGGDSGMFKLVSETKTKAYPNPVNRGEVFNVQASDCEDGVVAIFSIDGKYVKTVEFENGSAAIATEDMPQGMYVYTVQSKGKTVAKNKLIVK